MSIFKALPARFALYLFLLPALCVPPAAFAGQIMDEVWFPGGVIRWAPTQTTVDIEAGFDDTMNYYATRTPLKITKLDYINQGGLTPTALLGALEVRYSEGIFNSGYGGQTKHYRKPGQGNKKIKISFETVKTRSSARTTLAHEMGHALGFTHEFQRWDRTDNGVSVPAKVFGSGGGILGDYSYNYERPDKKNVRVLSPYDFASRFATGYNNNVSPNHNGPPTETLLSVRDINSIYRVYGRGLGSMDAGALYGEAAASADFDGDGIDDLAIAAQYSAPGASSGAIYFYKGVEQAPEEDGTGTTYVAWFREEFDFAGSPDRKIVLTTGDTHEMPSAGTASAAGDGISELFIGLPGAGRIEVWVINSVGRFADGLGVFGGHGVGHKIVIHARDVGISDNNNFNGFGSTLAVGRFFAGNGDDLAIAAPLGGGFTATVGDRVSGTSRVALPGRLPVVYLLPDVNPARALKIDDPSRDSNSAFGESLAVMDNFDHGHDTLVIGAPDHNDRGEVYVYRRSYYDNSGKAIAPDLLDSFTGSTTKSDFGKALATFTTREDGASREHWIAVGAPKANVSGAKSGSVVLYNFKYSGDRRQEHRLSPPARSDGMNFGQTIAIHNGLCTVQLCPKGRVWIAVGSPRSVVNGNKTGQVYLWNVWTGTELNRATAGTWNGDNDDARYGQDLVAVRSVESGGGFLITAKKTEVPVVNGTSVTTVRTGYAQVRLNKGGAASWNSWVRGLGPNTGADIPPKNR